MPRRGWTLCTIDRCRHTCRVVVSVASAHRLSHRSRIRIRTPHSLAPHIHIHIPRILTHTHTSAHSHLPRTRFALSPVLRPLVFGPSVFLLYCYYFSYFIILSCFFRCCRVVLYHTPSLASFRALSVALGECVEVRRLISSLVCANRLAVLRPQPDSLYDLSSADTPMDCIRTSAPSRSFFSLVVFSWYGRWCTKHGHSRYYLSPISSRSSFAPSFRFNVYYLCVKSVLLFEVIS